jgi:hypothetical protein
MHDAFDRAYRMNSDWHVHLFMGLVIAFKGSRLIHPVWSK